VKRSDGIRTGSAHATSQYGREHGECHWSLLAVLAVPAFPDIVRGVEGRGGRSHRERRRVIGILIAVGLFKFEVIAHASQRPSPENLRSIELASVVNAVLSYVLLFELDLFEVHGVRVLVEDSARDFEGSNIVSAIPCDDSIEN
jgi:hypothetical protein